MVSYIKRSQQVRRFATTIGALLISMFVFISCENSPHVDNRPLPDGWSRVQVREGYLARDNADGFTIDLPSGWSTGESWAEQGWPTGWITALREDEEQPLPQLYFRIGGSIRSDLERLLANKSVGVTQPVVEDQPMVLYIEGAPDFYERSAIGAFYEHIPGGPKGTEAPSMSIWGRSSGFASPDIVEQVLTSIRYKSFGDFQELPKKVVVPDEDWKRVPARPSWPTFTVRLPTGWEPIALQGLDAAPGEFRGDDFILWYEYGSHGRQLNIPNMANHEGDRAPHMIWTEKIGDVEVSFVKPLRSNPGEITMTSGLAKIMLQPNLWDEPTEVEIHSYRESSDGDRIGLTEEQQEIALAIFRTIEFE